MLSYRLTARNVGLSKNTAMEDQRLSLPLCPAPCGFHTLWRTTCGATLYKGCIQAYDKCSSAAGALRSMAMRVGAHDLVRSSPYEPDLAILEGKPRDRSQVRGHRLDLGHLVEIDSNFPHWWVTASVSSTVGVPGMWRRNQKRKRPPGRSGRFGPHA